MVVFGIWGLGYLEATKYAAIVLEIYLIWLHVLNNKLGVNASSQDRVCFGDFATRPFGSNKLAKKIRHQSRVIKYSIPLF